MDLKSTIEIILKDLAEARNIMDDLKNYPDIPAIQIEMAKAKCRSAEEVLKFIGDLKLSAPEHIINKEIEVEVNSKSSDDNRTEEESGNNIEVFEIADLEANNKKLPEDEIISKKSDENADILDQIVQPDTVDKVIVENDNNQPKGQIMADKFSKQSSINEKIAHKRYEDESAELSSHKPVTNLSEAIGLNDRFLYIRELFDGRQEIYNKTIISLNDSGSIDEAFNILTESCSPGHNSETFDQLLDLVKRKLSKH